MTAIRVIFYIINFHIYLSESQQQKEFLFSGGKIEIEEFQYKFSVWMEITIYFYKMNTSINLRNSRKTAS